MDGFITPWKILNVKDTYQMLISVGLAKALWEYKPGSLNWGAKQICLAENK